MCQAYPSPSGATVPTTPLGSTLVASFDSAQLADLSIQIGLRVLDVQAVLGLP